MNEGMTNYFIVAYCLVAAVKLGPIKLQQVHSACAVTHRIYCQNSYIVQRVYGQPCGLCMDSQKAKRKYISGIAAVTAGQILVDCILTISLDMKSQLS